MAGLGANRFLPCNLHRTQKATRKLSKSDETRYINNEWHSLPIVSSDRISTNLIKIFNTQELFIQRLIIEAFNNNDNILSLNISIPSNFIPLIDQVVNNNNNISKDSDLWIAFGVWLGMKNSFKKRQVHHYLKNLCSKINHSIKLYQKQQFTNPPPLIPLKKQPEIIESAYQTFQSISNLSQYRHIIYPECIVDKFNQTLIHLEYIDDFDAVIKATEAIDHYYFHTLNNPSHRSIEFWQNFVEHFGTYRRNNLLPFTSKNTASSHNIHHLPCVNLLLQNLEPLSNGINRFIQNNYPLLYSKLYQLSWGPFGPKPFGIFPMIAINFNTISDYHWDNFDEPNCLCCLMAFGNFQGGELNFPQLNIVIHLKPYQIVAFSSQLLLHGNFPILKGIRHSVVYFIHKSFFKNTQSFEVSKNQMEIESNSNPSDFYNAQGLNSKKDLSKPISIQTKIPQNNNDKRRNHICLIRARNGLKAEDPIV